MLLLLVEWPLEYPTWDIHIAQSVRGLNGHSVLKTLKTKQKILWRQCQQEQFVEVTRALVTLLEVVFIGLKHQVKCAGNAGPSIKQWWGVWGNFLKRPRAVPLRRRTLSCHWPCKWRFSQLLGRLEWVAVIQREQDTQKPLIYLISASRS